MSLPKKRKRASAKKRAPKKKTELAQPTLSDMVGNLRVLHAHLQLCVCKINELNNTVKSQDAHITWLHEKLKERTLLYNGKFRAMDSDIEHLQLSQSAERAFQPLEPIFDINQDSLPAEFEQDLMSVDELMETMENTAENENCN